MFGFRARRHSVSLEAPRGTESKKGHPMSLSSEAPWTLEANHFIRRISLFLASRFALSNGARHPGARSIVRPIPRRFFGSSLLEKDWKPTTDLVGAF